MIRSLRPIGVNLVLVLCTSAACAAVPVEESSASGRTVAAASTTQSPAAAAPRGGAQTARLSELFYQLQVLQDEVRALRGTVEEQGHLINRLRKDQKEQYLDLDQRVLRLTNRSSAGRSSAGATAGSGTPTGNSAPPRNAGANNAPQPELRDGEVYVTTPATGTPPTSDGARGGEQAAYTAAFDQMKARDFDASIRSFNKLIVDYPGGEYTGHAFYWLGELYLAKSNEQRARTQFAQVIDLYPGHSKRGDALYKMGVVLHRLGDNHKALEYLNRVRAEHPGTKAADLAADYAKEMQ